MATIALDQSKCTVCGACTLACPNQIMRREGNAMAVDTDLARYCLMCGQCLAACPVDAIRIQEFADTLSPLPADTVTPAQLEGFFARRRSVRVYQDRPVERAVVERALQMAALAPLSFPPWVVEVTTVLDRQKIAELSAMIAVQMEKMVKMNSNFIGRLFLKLMVGAGRYQFMDEFFIPLMAKGVAQYHQHHADIWLRSAPALMVFHTGPTALDGAADSWLAAGQAAQALQSLGLGVCFNGLATGTAKMDKNFLKALGIPTDHTLQAAFTFGYPRVTYHKRVQRPFKAQRFVGA